MTTGKIIRLAVLTLSLMIGIAFYFYPQAENPTAELENIGTTYYAGLYKVQLKLSPDKPRVANNTLGFLIRNVQDQPVSNAKIKAVAIMPAMGTMPEMREKLNIEEQGKGAYQGEFNLPMNGSWPLSIEIKNPDLGKAELSLDMNTSRAGLKLIAATASDMASEQMQAVNSEQLDTLQVDAYRRQLIGVTTSEVLCLDMVKTIHAGARVNYDETRLFDINLKYDAWIGSLNADYVGKQIRKGETLFTVYNPELVSAQDEYLNSLRRKRAGTYSLQKAARSRLERLDISASEIRSLAQRGRAIKYMPIVSPSEGTVIEKNMVTGAAVKAGERLLRIADLSTLWVEAEVYEADLPWIKPGMQAKISFPDMPGQTVTAEVSFIEPVLHTDTRTAIVRVPVANPDGLLRPGLYARVDLQVDLGERFVVPEQAVIYSGEQRVVFLDLGEGRLQPRKITTGLRNDGYIEVLEGLRFGDIVVTSGNFLIAAESKFKSGLAQW